MKYECQRSKTKLHDFHLIENVERTKTYYTSNNIEITSPAYQLERCDRCGYRLVTYTEDERTLRSIEYARLHLRDFLQPGDSRYETEYGRKHALTPDEIQDLEY